MLSDAAESIKDTAAEGVSAAVDSAIDPLFTQETAERARNWADSGFRSILWDLVSWINDPIQRKAMHDELLNTFQPIARKAINTAISSMETLRTAIHLLLRGEIEEAFSVLNSAVQGVLAVVRSALSEDVQRIVFMVQHLATTLLEQGLRKAAEGSLEEADIQGRVQQKADEARGSLQEKIGTLQEGVREAQGKFKSISGNVGVTSGRSGMPPFGVPPNGFPPSGRPPWGMPPTGRPPRGMPPSGLPPEVHRRRKEAEQRMEAGESGRGASQQR